MDLRRPPMRASNEPVARHALSQSEDTSLTRCSRDPRFLQEFHGHTACSSARMLGRSALVALLIGSNLLAGCSAHQAQAAGGTIGVLGGATTIVGIGVAAGCEPFPDDEETTCQTDDWEPHPVPGLQTAGVGLFLLGLGALIYWQERTTTRARPLARIRDRLPESRGRLRRLSSASSQPKRPSCRPRTIRRVRTSRRIRWIRRSNLNRARIRIRVGDA